MSDVGNPLYGSRPMLSVHRNCMSSELNRKRGNTALELWWHQVIQGDAFVRREASLNRHTTACQSALRTQHHISSSIETCFSPREGGSRPRRSPRVFRWWPLQLCPQACSASTTHVQVLSTMGAQRLLWEPPGLKTRIRRGVTVDGLGYD